MESTEDQPLVLGTSFIAPYAESLGLDAQETMDALINDAGIRHFRLVSYWNQLEVTQGTYDFSLLDWQFEKAEASGSKVSLAIGLRQPRWPECHMPDWAKSLPKEQWQSQLENFIAATVNRYKDSPALVSYQLENEFFLESFGHCPDFSRDRLISEFELVKKLDPDHPVIMTRSNNTISWAAGEPKADIVGMSVYRRVWNDQLYKGYFNYPMPAWYYGFIAGVQKLVFGQESILHEMQAEPWPPNGQPIVETTLEEQNKSFDSTALIERVEFAKDTGLREIYLWGGEYWYYRKEVLGEPKVWESAKEIFKENN